MSANGKITTVKRTITTKSKFFHQQIHPLLNIKMLKCTVKMAVAHYMAHSTHTTA